MATEFLYITAAGTNFVLALVLLLNNVKKRANQLLAVLSTSLGFWLSTSYISDVIRDEPLFWNKLVFVGPILIPLVFFLFIRKLSGKEKKYNRFVFFYFIISITLLLSLFITDLFVKDLSQRFNVYGEFIGYNIIRGPLYYIFIFYLLTLLLAGITLLAKTYYSSKGILRSQLRYVVAGTIGSVVWALFFSVLLVNFTGSSEYGLYGAMSGVIMVGFYFIAIIKHQFLDISSFILRFVVYIISLIIIVITLSVFSFFITFILFGQQEISVERSIYYIATAVLVAIIFGPLKDFVNKVTNNIFYRQSYSVHVALNEVSNHSTRSVETKQIQSHTIKIIDQTISPEYAGFVMFDQEGNLTLEMSSHAYPSKILKLEGFINELSKLRQKITTAEDVKETAHLKHYLELAHIGVITRLSTSNKSIGFLILGEKKNGGSYNSQDFQFLSLMANDLALAIQNAKRYEEIQAFNETLQYKINDATKALKRTNEKLIALDDAKDDFISMASHQLRTPLTSIKGYLSMTLDGDLGKVTPAQRQALKEAFDSSQRMVFLISDFLNVSRIRTGKFALEIAETNLTELVSEEISQLRDMAGLRGQKITFNPPSNFPVVRLDEMKTRQVMMNMIDNAIFYTPKNGNIEIVLEKTKSEIIFKVIDSGIGVPLKDQHRLFTKFFRAPNAKNARPDGTGLGLFMAQKIIAAQGGKIIFKSVEGQGSTFGFRFPLHKVSLTS